LRFIDDGDAVKIPGETAGDGVDDGRSLGDGTGCATRSPASTTWTIG
jgi:hypothetical protein